jgi:four helix bundle protein
MRDHRKLDVFRLADALALRIYEATKAFPEDERYGLSAQLRRAAVSVAANIVEGAARSSQADFLRMLGIAYASACELEYEISLARRLGYVPPPTGPELSDLTSQTCRSLRGLIHALRGQPVR